MADTQVYIQRLIFDTSDPDITKVTVEIKHNDYGNILMKNRYEKVFPARIPVTELLAKHMFGQGEDHYLMW